MYNSYKSVLCTTEKTLLHYTSYILQVLCFMELLGLLIFILLPVQPFHLINKKRLLIIIYLCGKIESILPPASKEDFISLINNSENK